ncbi:acetate--CoA ligase family protein [Alcaligenaceae bacterium]|nr:acetate--CoA ligase family protein [Alcaligenaceae bacterium]
MRDLTPLLRPRSIAMVGASSDPMRGNGRTFRYLMQGGFEGAVFAVNPRRTEVQGRRCWPSIDALPQPVDAVIIALPAPDVARALRECAASQARSAIVFAGGFAETGESGQQAQDELAGIAREAGMLLLGPNSLGAYDGRSRSYMTFSSMFEEGFSTGGRIGMVTQSGGWGSQARRLAQDRGMAIVQWVSTGNECDVDAAEVLHSMALDPDIDVMLLYLEGIRNGDRMIQALEAARSRRKPVVAIKVGRTQAGQAAAASHTASLTGEDRVFDAVCRHFGVHRADSIEELLDVAYAAQHAVHHGRMPTGPSTAILSPSGGFAVHMTDQLIRQGLALPAPPAQVQEEILRIMPHAIVNNPVDLTGQVLNKVDDFGHVLDLLLAGPEYDAADIFVGMAGAAPALRGQWLDTLSDAAGKHPGKWLGVSVLANADTIRRYEEAGFAVFEDTARMVNAHGALVRAAAAFGQPPLAPDSAAPVEWPRAPATEADAKALIAALGISIPRERVCRDAAEAAAFADTLGVPAAVKVVSADIPHKTEAGGVALGLDDGNAVRAAVESMSRRVGEARPDARIDGYLVSAMAPQGMDCMLGLRNDPALGPVVVFGAGGVMAEWLEDISIRLAPVSASTALSMIAETRIHKLLKGWRGAPAGDLQALAAAIAAVSRLGAASAGHDLEINPLRVLPEGEGVVALDALITLNR